MKIALRAIARNRSRSALTVLGVVIGIAAIILLESLGAGAQDLILRQIQGMGAKTVVVMPGREPRGPSDFVQILSSSLKERDLESLRRKTSVPSAEEVMPIVFGAETASYRGETFRLTIFGSSSAIARILDLTPSEGAFFSEDDVKGRGEVIVIGDKVREELFGDAPAVGERIKIKNRNFRVVGVLPRKGQVSFFNFDEAAVAPYTAVQSYVLGIRHFQRLIVEASSEDAIPRTVRDIEATIRNSHGITDPEKDDFHVETPADLAETLGVVTNVLTLFLVAVAAISLVVGGIGIMNIMLVAVTERTREIGLRKAVGATYRDILTQFLFEAAMLTAFGGLIGVSLGAFFSFLATLVLGGVVALDWRFTFPVTAALLGLGVALLVGLVFGLYPARRAAKLNPIEALRYE